MEQQLEEITRKILSFFNIDDPEIKIEEQEKNFHINIRVTDAGSIIGRDGEILFSLEQIIRSIASKMGAEKSVVIDINGYRLQKESYIRELAQKAGRQVMITKKEVFLPPMNSYERRLVHMELSINPDIATESVGQPPERRIVIKPRV